MWFFKKNKDEFCLVLDIGTEAAKCLIFNISDDNKILLLGAGLNYYKEYDVFGSNDIEIEIIKKSIIKAVEDACRKLSFSTAVKKVKEKTLVAKNLKLFATLPPDIFKSEIILEVFSRSSPKEKISSREERQIKNSVIDNSKRKIADVFSQQAGILSEDVRWNSFEVLETKIDGYSVPEIKGYDGKEIEFRMLFTFMPGRYWDGLKKIFGLLGFNIKSIIHPAECFEDVFRSKKTSGVFIDVGGGITQIFAVKEGKLRAVADFKGGAKFFEEIISNVLGMGGQEARIMIERYCRSELSEGAAKRIREMFYSEKNQWYNNFKKTIDAIVSTTGFPSEIFLAGGGAMMPEIKDILNDIIKNDWAAASFGHSALKRIDFKELGVEDTIKISDNYQWIIPILISLKARNS